jgi:glycosyltransferase involved in cell wall biosynthesis
MKVLALVPSLYDTSPGQRFRIEQWEPILRREGIDITYSAFEDERQQEVLYRNGKAIGKVRSVVGNMGRRGRTAAAAGQYDLVYIFREAAVIGPAWYERRIARSGVPIVFDFDDAVFVPYRSPSNGYLSYLKFPQKTSETCRLAAHVMAGNAYLAEYARRFNENVTIVPTTIDTDKYRLVERPANPEKLTIGWSGSHSTVQHLDTIRDVLKTIGASERVRLRVIGTSSYDVDAVEVEASEWRPETEVDDLGEIDIGLMPLPDDRWARGKCGLKALQYMALGIPTICSPVGVNTTIITDGENGYLASNTAEWLEKIRRLLGSAELRKRVGLAGRRTVEERFSAKVIAPKVIEIFKATADACRGRKVNA